MKTRLVGKIIRSPLVRSMSFALFITTFVSGCLAFPMSKDSLNSLATKDEVKTLVGESQESVIRTLGIPDQWVIQGEREFMTYSVTSSGRKTVPVIWGIPLGVYDDAGQSMHCYRLEVDSNNMVKDYKIDSTARLAQHPNCQHLLTNDWELANLEIHAMRNIPAQSQFKEGDLISVTTNKGITIASTKITSLKIAVVESDSTKIKGRLSGFLSDVDETMENELGSVVEIMRVDIVSIWIETGDIENIWIETGDIENIWIETGLGKIYCKSGGVRQYVKHSQCDTPKSEKLDRRPKTTLYSDCQVSDQTLDTIKTTKQIYTLNDELNLRIRKLIEEAEKAAKPPECDSIRAKILADKAYQEIIEFYQ